MARTEVLTREALGRATLARQLLLERARLTPAKAIERIGGMQAQQPRPPFVGLWSRLAGFSRDALVRALDRREIVRATSMRATLHLVTARDFIALRAALQPMLTAAMTGVLRERARGLDVAKLLEVARELLDQPRTFDELRPRLAKVFPALDERVLGYAVRTHLPLVQVPVADATWGFPSAAAFALAERWLDAACAPADPRALVLRYLAAFGPATVADAQSWSGLGGLRDVFAALRPKLRSFEDETGRELYDLPRAPRPPANTPVPVRLLPEFDSLVLAFADRRRLVDEEHRAKLITKNLQIPATILVGGRIAGTWKLERTKAAATVAIAPFRKLPAAARAELVAEAIALAKFAEPDAARHAVSVA